MELKNTEEAVRKSLDLFRSRFKQNAPKASGKLDDSAEDVILVADKFISGSVVALSYWVYQVFGRGASHEGNKPGKVKEKIKEWISAKNLPEWKRKKKDGSDGKTMTRDEQAFLITRKIHREGFTGTFDLQALIDEIQPEVDKLIEEGLAKDFLVLNKNL